VLLNRSIVFLPASRALQLNNIRRFGHHRKSLAHAFLAAVSAMPAICNEQAVNRSELDHGKTRNQSKMPDVQSCDSVPKVQRGGAD
jgi:hypothetical protein